MKILVYGSSDDLIELEELDEFGARKANGWDAEFQVGPQFVSYLGFSSGTLLRVSYDGFWHVVALEKGACKIDRREATDVTEDYSDMLTLECVDGFSWVVCAEDMERLTSQLDMFVS